MAQENLTSVEIERKYVLIQVPEGLENFPVTHIQQGYLVITPDSELRIRKKTSGSKNKFEATYKSGHGEVRQEFNFIIDEATFEKLWPETQGKQIEKNRYEVPLPQQNLTAEIDVYISIPGLAVMEVEFTTAEQAASFVLTKEFFGARDVTGQTQFENQSLAQYGLVD